MNGGQQKTVAPGYAVRNAENVAPGNECRDTSRNVCREAEAANCRSPSQCEVDEPSSRRTAVAGCFRGNRHLLGRGIDAPPEARLTAISLLHAFCVVGMGLVPLPVGDQRSEPRARQQVARGVAVAFGAAVIERGIDHSAIEQGCRQGAPCSPGARLPASVSSCSCPRSH